MTTGVDPQVRAAVLTAGLCSLTAAVLSGVLPLGVLPVAALLLVLACRLAADDPSWRRGMEHVATAVAVVAVVVSIPNIQAGGAGGLRDSLGPLLIGVQLAQAVSWTSLRQVQTGLLVSVGLLLMGASFAPDLVAGLPLLAGWAACLVSVLLIVGQRARASADIVVASAEGGGDGRPPGSLAAVTGLALVVGLIAFLLVPVPQSESLQRRMTRGQSDQPTSARAQAYNSDVVDTSLRGALSDRPLAEVDADSPRLWRNRAFTTWDGRAWSATSSPVSYPGNGTYAVADAPVGRTDTVTLRTRSGTVWAPGRVVSLEVDGPLVGDADRDGGLRVPFGTDSYRVSTAAQDLRNIETDTPVSSDPALLALPDRTTDRTRRLAEQITAGATSTIGKVRAVERWLTANAAYSLDSPVPGSGEDAVDRFLFVDRVGFCEQFAAAEVVLLRAAGIPARFVTGLAYGTDAGRGTRTFREKDLHAWVEVPFARAGWVASDPTAGAALAVAGQRSWREHASAALRSVLDATLRFPGGREGIAAVLGVLLLLGWLWRRRAAGRPEPSIATGEPVLSADTAPPALAAFLRLDDRLASDGRAPAESISELAGRLGATGQRAEALAVVEEECYGAVAPDPDQAVAVLDGWDPGPDAR